jgi:hypothetical protein
MPSEEKGPLSAPFAWTCPFCDCSTTINRDDFSSSNHLCTIKNKHGPKWVFTHLIICPNPECKEFSLVVELFQAKSDPRVGWVTKEFDNEWTLVPPFKAKAFPDYIPRPILDDYYEACQIRELSPKASATLARRCIQGMIRDYWGIVKSRLIDEIKELEGKVDLLTWQAIDAVRKVGNVGAHMEKDVNLVIDIDPQEAALLINLVEILLADWYVARYEREKSLNTIVTIGKQKR